MRAMKKIVAGVLQGPALLAVLALLGLSGCGARPQVQSFLRPEVNLGYIRTVAVLPFEQQAGAAEQIREIAMTQLLASGLFDVLDKGRVDSALREEAIERGMPLDNPTLRRLGQRLGVQAFLLGSVDQAGVSQAGGSVYPEITLTLRLIDAEAGTLLWQASGRGSGYSLADRLFGLNPKNSFEVTLDLLTRLLGTMGKAGG